jgi:hypothetical protein
LSADQILYLHAQEVPQNVIKALMPAGNATVAAPAVPPAPNNTPPPISPAPQVYAPAPATPGPPPTPMPAPPPTTVSLDNFRSQLAPYGTWLDLPGYGLCWRPLVSVTEPYWRPYCDQGHWVYTADGWFWQSDYPWGDIAFHYGRWFRDSVGWVWVPGYDWAPAWVCWRHTEGYCGWAPLPPGAVFKVGLGLSFGGRIAADIDFGLGVDAFTFVPYDRFWEHNLHGFILPHDRLLGVYRRSVILNGYRYDHGRFIVEGLGRDRIARFTHHEVRVEEIRGRDEHFRGHVEPERRPANDEKRDHRDR